MAWKITNVTIIPKNAIPFDEWFDSLPVDYFKDNPDACGKNKFELLEDTLSPPENPNIRIIAPVEPTSTTTVKTETDDSIIETTTEIWSSRMVCVMWEQQHLYKHNPVDGKDGLEDIIEKLQAVSTSDSEQDWYNIVVKKTESGDIWLHGLVPPEYFLNNFYASVFGITNTRTYELA